MNGFAFLMTLFVIWFWFNPESAGKWMAKAKKAFQEASHDPR